MAGLGAPPASPATNHSPQDCSPQEEPEGAEGAPPLQVKVLYHDGDAVSCALPPHVVAQVAELVGSPMGTAPRLFYRARLEGGLHTKVPHHVAPKDLVVIDAKALHFVRKHEE